MTEDRWRSCDDPEPMVRSLDADRHQGALRLFAAGCVRRVWTLVVGDALKEAVEVSEAYAEGRADATALGRAAESAAELAGIAFGGVEAPDARAYAASAAADAASAWPRTAANVLAASSCAASARACAAVEGVDDSRYDGAFEAARREELAAQADLLRRLVPRPGRDRQEHRVDDVEVRVARVLAKVEAAGLRLEPCPTREEVEGFEESTGVTLPEAYRAFLLAVGNGGDGPPCDGLARLGEGPPTSDRASLDFWRDLPCLALPFPFTEDWVWERGETTGEGIGEQVRHGSVYLGTDDAGDDLHLIVTGPDRGRIWTVSWAGICAIRPKVDFLDWFEGWLDGRSRPAAD